MFVWNEAGESSAYVTEIKDFTLYGMGAQHVLDQGINLWNGMQNFNVHDIDFHATGHSGVWAFGFGSKGVIWNCNFYDIYAAGNGYSVRIDARADGDTWFGDSSWAAPVNWGSDEFVFIEDCLFDNGRSSIDGHEGGRYVARHNIFQNGWTNLDYVADHGRAPCTNSNRGMRAMEIYQNTFYHSSNYTNGIDVMGGDWLIWDNDFNAWPTAPAGYCIYYDVADCDRCPSYPASDQSRDSYVWNNRRNGITFTSWNSPELINGCETLIQEGRDIHFNVPASYTPYTYPHPLRSS
jgi:hypothetical protein